MWLSPRLGVLGSQVLNIEQRMHVHLHAYALAACGTEVANILYYGQQMPPAVIYMVMPAAELTNSLKLQAAGLFLEEFVLSTAGYQGASHAAVCLMFCSEITEGQYNGALAASGSGATDSASTSRQYRHTSTFTVLGGSLG